AIENNDKAITLLLRCKEISPENEVVDHELAKAYLEEGNLVAAKEYGSNALNSRPENLWYLNTLVGILSRSGNSIDQIQSQIPVENRQLRENLALIYYWRGDYEDALKILKGIEKSPFTENLLFKVNDLRGKSKNIPPSLPMEN